MEARADNARMAFDAIVAAGFLAFALWLKPWRFMPRSPAWPALALWALLPLLWSLDVITASPLIQPFSGAPLLALMVGWPLAALALAPVALAAALLGDLGGALALHRLVWLGLLPASVSGLLSAMVLRWLPHNPFVYILGRGFFATWIALALVGALAWNFPSVADGGDLALARLLTASGEAFLTGMVAAIFVAFRPHWLATYSDAIYLKPPPAG